MANPGNQVATEKEQEVFDRAYALFNRKPNWVTFFREILGVAGIVRKKFTTQEEMKQFEETETYANIQQMLTRLREADISSPPQNGEPNQVITVRLPKSLHDLLREEAYEHRTSMNKLCISKLLQIIDKNLIPEDR
ncbi:MAG: toxin-antitoxin system HicB family antitoxin [Thermoguttaceae bacterium]